MEKENKFIDFFRKITDSESALKRIPFYFFLICVLLVVLIFKLGKTNQYLRIIAENGTSNIEYETRDDTFIEVITEDKKEIEDYIPLLEEVTDETTTEKKTNVSAKETTTKSNKETTTNNTTHSSTTTQTSEENNVTKKTYILNINSKKIHYPDCSSAARTKEENKKTVNLSKDELQNYINDGYTFCKTCGGE